MPPREGGIGLRRNGKQQACEPCRKGKLACDHSVPHCGRCVRRNTISKCIYHPAPMTRTRAPNPLPSPQHTPSITSNQSQTNGPSQSSQSRGMTNLTSQREPSLVRQSSSSGQSSNPQALNDKSIAEALETNNWYGRSWEVGSTFPRSARYYGPTSFSSVFIENDLLDTTDENRKHPSSWPFGQPLLGRDRPSAPTVRMNQVIRTLWNIPSQETCESLMATFDSLHHVVMHIVLVRHFITTLWSNFGDELAAPRTSERLTRIAETLFKNEERPLPPAPDDGMEWLNTFTGPNIRFEMLGMFFCFLGQAYQSLQDWDARFRVPENHGRDRRQTSWRMKECADICLKMCEISDTNNEISVAAMLCTTILESVCTGDESLQLRRRHAETVVSALAVGLHRLDHGTNKITTALEYKRRLISAIYCTDKNESSLDGVPVGLSQKFCHLSLPADLAEEDLFLPQEELVRAINQLDDNGWNQNGDLHLITIHRAIQVLARRREEILEVALGVDIALSPQQIDDLHQRCQQAYNALPSQTHYYEYGTTPKNSTGRVLLGQAYLMLINLQNRFLIERVATARGFPNDQGLLNTAMEMLELSIMYWVKRDQLMLFYNNFDWIVTCYGIPSSGVVCVELLRQTRGQSRLQFSRSDAIQKLTLFIGFLEWIRPTDGNYELAGRLKTVIRRVVDHVLDMPTPVGNPSDFQQHLDLDPVLPLDDNTIGWLNTIDWTQGSWMEFN